MTTHYVPLAVEAGDDEPSGDLDVLLVLKCNARETRLIPVHEFDLGIVPPMVTTDLDSLDRLVDRIADVGPSRLAAFAGRVTDGRLAALIATSATDAAGARWLADLARSQALQFEEVDRAD